MITAIQAVSLTESAIIDDLVLVNEAVKEAAMKGETKVELKVTKPSAVCSVLRPKGFRLTIGIEGLVRIEW